MAWSDVTSGVLDGMSAGRHDEQAATNDASIGVQVQLPPRSNFPHSSTPACRGPSAWRTKDKNRPLRHGQSMSRKLRQGISGITSKKLLMGYFQAQVQMPNTLVPSQL